METESRQHEREIAQREVESRLELKRKADRLSALYREANELFGSLIDEQNKQFEQEVRGIKDVKQDVVVEKLTKELKGKVDELYRINKR